MTQDEYCCTMDAAAILGEFPQLSQRKLQLFACACWRECSVDAKHNCAWQDLPILEALEAGRPTGALGQPKWQATEWTLREGTYAAQTWAELMLDKRKSADILRDVIGNPYRPVTINERLTCSRGHRGAYNRSALQPVMMKSYPVPPSQCVVCQKEGPPWPDVVKGKPPAWVSTSVVNVASALLASRPIIGRLDEGGVRQLHDMLLDEGCDNHAILEHLVDGQTRKCPICGGLGYESIVTPAVWMGPSHAPARRHKVRDREIGRKTCDCCKGSGWVSHEPVHYLGCWVIDLLLQRE